MRPHVGQHRQPQIAKAQFARMGDLVDDFRRPPDGFQVVALALARHQHPGKHGLRPPDQAGDRLQAR